MARPTPGVARGRLDDRAARLQPALPLGRLDHGQGRAVLDAAAGVEVLELGQEMAGNIAAGPVQRQQRGLADEVQKAIGHLHGRPGVRSGTDVDAPGNLHCRVVGEHHERETGVVDLGRYGGGGGAPAEDNDQSREPGAQLGQRGRRQAAFGQGDDTSGPGRQPVRRFLRRHRH